MVHAGRRAVNQAFLTGDEDSRRTHQAGLSRLDSGARSWDSSRELSVPPISEQSSRNRADDDNWILCYGKCLGDTESETCIINREDLYKKTLYGCAGPKKFHEIESV